MTTTGQSSSFSTRPSRCQTAIRTVFTQLPAASGPEGAHTGPVLSASPPFLQRIPVEACRANKTTRVCVQYAGTLHPTWTTNLRSSARVLSNAVSMVTLPRHCHRASPAQRPAYPALARPAAAAIQFSAATGPPNPTQHPAQLPDQSGSAAKRHYQRHSHKGSAHRRHCVCAAAAAPHPTSHRTTAAAANSFGTRCYSEGSLRHRRSVCGAAANYIPPLVSAAAPGAAAERDFARSPLVFGHEFIAPMKVRAFEIDQYAVVNNAVYVQYLQHGAPLYSHCRNMGRPWIWQPCLCQGFALMITGGTWQLV